MIDIVAFILTIITIYLIFFASSKVLNCSILYLLSCCVEFVVSVIRFFCTKTEKPVDYPVHIGWDGNRIDLRIVNKEFDKLIDNFIVCYCSRYSYIYDRTCIAYSFEIQRKIDSFEDDILISIIQKQAEEVVAKIMYENDCTQSAESLTAVELEENRLIIAYALNPSGMKKLEDYKYNTYIKRMESTKKIQQNNFVEDWEENE